MTNTAVGLIGSNGILPEFHLEKYFRNSKIVQLIQGGRQVSRYRVVRGRHGYIV